MSENNLNPKFQFAQMKEQIHDQAIEGKAIGFFKDAMIRFTRNKAAISASIVIGIIVLFSIIGPSLSPYGWNEQNIQYECLPARIPGLEKLGICDGTKEMKVQRSNVEAKYGDILVKIVDEYNAKGTQMATIKVDAYKKSNASDKYFWFGTDSLGRSQWTRLWRGARVSLLIGLISAAVNVFIGIVYGSISGYYGGMVDMLMQRFIEIITMIPMYVILILFIMFYGTGFFSIAMAMVVTGWIGTSNIIRAQFYRYKGQEYVLASRTMGARDRRIIFRHILPNGIGPVITSASLAIPGAIMGEAGLAYLGLGLQAPEPSIGILLAQGQQTLLVYPHLTVFPSILISILMIAFNLLGNGLRDAFNPTLRGTE